jgi:hypothetical protein
MRRSQKGLSSKTWLSERGMRTQPESWARVVFVMSRVMPLPVECPPGRQMPPLISTAT